MADLERFQIVRPLGTDVSTLLARDTSSTPPRPVVLERIVRGVDPAATARLVRRARALVSLEHPKVVPVREVVEREADVLVVSELVDGEWLAAVLALEPRPPLPILLRLVLDVLEGLAALHDLPNEQGQPLRIVHGHLSPETVVVAEDGVAELARPCAGSPRRVERFVAPELRRGDGPADVRSDIYAVGAMLRDVLGGAPADAKWAEPLTEIASRACAVEIEDRFPTAAAMATAIRRVVSTRLAPAADVATVVKKHFGVRIKARRASVVTQEDTLPPSSGEPISVRPSDLLVIDPPSTPGLPVDARSDGTKPAHDARTPPPSAARHAPPPRPPSRTPPPPSKHGERAEDPMAAALPPPRPRAPSLPPPDIVPDLPAEEVPPAPASVRRSSTADAAPSAAAPTASSPPEAPAPRSAAAPKGQPAAKASAKPAGTLVAEPPVEAYRRQLPTLPTAIEVPSRSPIGAIAAVGAVVVAAFTAGWFVGRDSGATAGQLACASSAAAAAQAQALALASRPVVAQAPPVVAAPPPATSSAPPLASAAPSSSASSASPTAAAPASPSPTTAAPASTSPVAPQLSSPGAGAPAPRPAATPKPPSPPAATPQPPATSGYSPGEL